MRTKKGGRKGRKDVSEGDLGDLPMEWMMCSTPGCSEVFRIWDREGIKTPVKCHRYCGADGKFFSREPLEKPRILQ